MMSEVKSIVDSRSILKALIVKNLFGSYRNSFLGFAWHFVMPVVMLIVYYIAFTQIRESPLPDFWIFLSSGLFPFTFMLTNLTMGSGSIVNNSEMVKKLHFPRSILVFSQVISTFIIMLISYSIVIIAIYLSGYGVGISYLALPIILILMFFFVIGYCLFFSSLSVYARDVMFLLNAISIVFYFLTPIYFTTDSTVGSLNTIVSLNPFTYYLEACHSIVYYFELPDMRTIIACLTLPLISLSIGIITFNKLKKGFVERL